MVDEFAMSAEVSSFYESQAIDSPVRSEFVYLLRLFYSCSDLKTLRRITEVTRLSFLSRVRNTPPADFLRLSSPVIGTAAAAEFT